MPLFLSGPTFSAQNSLNQLKRMRQSKLTQEQQTEVARKKKDIEARKAMKPEYCPMHNEAIVGYIEGTSELVCNTCIFKKKL